MICNWVTLTCITRAQSCYFHFFDLGIQICLAGTKGLCHICTWWTVWVCVLISSSGFARDANASDSSGIPKRGLISHKRRRRKYTEENKKEVCFPFACLRPRNLGWKQGKGAFLYCRHVCLSIGIYTVMLTLQGKSTGNLWYVRTFFHSLF